MKIKHLVLLLSLLILALLVYFFTKSTDVDSVSAHVGSKITQPAKESVTPKVARQAPNVVRPPVDEFEDEVSEKTEVTDDVEDFGEDVIEYQFEWGVPLSPPPPGRGPLPVIKQVPEFSDSTALPDMRVQSDWPPLTCSVGGGKLHFVIGGDHETWPTSLPESGTATCLLEDDHVSYQIEIELSQGEPIPW